MVHRLGNQHAVEGIAMDGRKLLGKPMTVKDEIKPLMGKPGDQLIERPWKFVRLAGALLAIFPARNHGDKQDVAPTRQSIDNALRQPAIICGQPDQDICIEQQAQI